MGNDRLAVHAGQGKWGAALSAGERSQKRGSRLRQRVDVRLRWCGHKLASTPHRRCFPEHCREGTAQGLVPKLEAGRISLVRQYALPAEQKLVGEVAQQPMQ